MIKLIKYKELKKGVYYAIPCRRSNGKEDFVTICVREQDGKDIIFFNNRFMGASLKQVRNDAFWFVIE